MAARAAAGGALHVETTGTGPPLVLLHGWAMHGGLFAPIVADLARRHRVHVVDLPGHGHSAPVDPYTLDAVVAGVEAHFAASEGSDGAPVAVLGWSFGGTVAMRWAQRHPARVARLVLVCATPRFVTGDGWTPGMAATTLARFGDELAASYRLTLQRFLTLQVQGSDEGRATLAALRAQLFARGEPARTTLAAALRTLAETDLRAAVPALRTPALVVTGTRDALTPAAAGAWLAATLPHATLAQIEGAAHAPFLSHRASFLHAVEAFLDAR